MCDLVLVAELLNVQLELPSMVSADLLRAPINAKNVGEQPLRYSCGSELR